MTSDALWPPLALIRRSLTAQALAPQSGHAAPPLESHTPPTAAPSTPDDACLLLPLTELARRREALAQRSFGTHWAPGRLLRVTQADGVAGLLLDQVDATGIGTGNSTGAERWHAWWVASEPDWAGAFDVLLEPQDEPFEPALAMVQTWNRVRVVRTPELDAQVLGELSATRLAAVRALALQAELSASSSAAAAHTAHTAHAGPARPGFIALRSVDGFSVLTGSSLGGSDDPRREYQALYGQRAQRFVASQPAWERAAASLPTPTSTPTPTQGGWGARLREWCFGSGAGGLWRPVAGALALVLVLQNVGPLLGGVDGLDGAADDSVRLRQAGRVPASAPLVAAPDLRIAWRAGTDMAAAAQLLRQADAQVIAGPDAHGIWSLQLLHPEEGRRVLQSSPLVELR